MPPPSDSRSFPYFPIPSVRIDTTDLYEKFQNGDLNIIDKIVDITADAEPDLAVEPRLLWNVPCKLLRLADHSGNRIEMRPADGYLNAYLQSGDDLLLGIPSNYKKYHLEFPNAINVTAAEVDYVYQWTNAAEISIIEGGKVPDLAHRLTLRKSRMRGMRQLWKLHFKLHASAVRKLSVAKLLSNLPTLEVVSVDVTGLGLGQIDRFVVNQGSVDGWAIKMSVEMVVFERKG